MIRLIRVHRPESAGGDVEVAGAVEVEAKVGVELFAGEQRRAG